MLDARDDDSGAVVDWWFMYKLPKGVGPKSKHKTKGNEYLYYDATPKIPLQLSPHALGTSRHGALYHTLQQLFEKPGSNTGWIFYNDEYPESMRKGDWPPNVPPKIHGPTSRKKDRGKPVDHPTNGHCKGVLAFDLATNTAFWLSHSTPRIPALHVPAGKRFYYPEYSYEYAQTFICITLDSVETACRIANVTSTQHEPQVFGCSLPKAVTRTSRWAPLWKLAQGQIPPKYGEDYAKTHKHRKPSEIRFKSKAGKTFWLIAKSGAWFDDFWIDLVGPSLEEKGGKGVDLRVETWRRLTPTATLPGITDRHGKEEFGPHDFTTTYLGRKYHHEFMEKLGKHVDDEVTNIDLGMLTDTEGDKLTGYGWPYTKDHAKWAISEEDENRGVQTLAKHHGIRLAEAKGNQGDWICVADINRMTSQERRGGGAICFNEPLLWHGLNEIERISGKIT